MSRNVLFPSETSRNVLFPLCIVVAVAISALLFRDGLVMPTDAEITSRLPEEILGFGYLSVWLFVAIFEAPFIVFPWLWSRGNLRRRAIAAAAVLVFGVASVVGFVGYRRQMARVLGVSSVSITKALFF